MKLITEYTENNLSSMTEEVDGEKNVYIEGIFMQAEKKNRNGRIYERRVIIPAVERYVSEQVVTGRAVGELGGNVATTQRCGNSLSKLFEITEV